jgi:hypothetical protein
MNLQQELERDLAAGIAAVNLAGEIGIKSIFEHCDICDGESLWEPEQNSCPCCGGLGGYEWVQLSSGKVVSQKTFDLAMRYNTIVI